MTPRIERLIMLFATLIPIGMIGSKKTWASPMKSLSSLLKNFKKKIFILTLPEKINSLYAHYENHHIQQAQEES